VDIPYPLKKPAHREPPPFEPDRVFYASDIEKNGWQVRLPLESLGQQVMIIYIDIVVYSPQEVAYWKQAPASLVASVLREGTVLYERDK